MVALKSAVLTAQARFLGENPDYVAMRPISIIEYEPGRFNIDAPIDTAEAKLEMEQAARQQQAEIALADIQFRRRQASLQRRHKKLQARHFDRLTPGIKAVWWSFDIGQQYAILKDIDYVWRHGQG